MNRQAMLSQIEDSSIKWDLIIIGGGATGLGCAVDAAARGLRTLLLEQGDFSQGTSSRSTKLIHGGVRYLQQGDIPMVRDSLRERGHLLKNAPHLVKPLPFVIPAYRWYEPYYYTFGMKVYDLLSGKRSIDNSLLLSKDKVIDLFPNLKIDGLTGGTLYWDAQFDDARMVIALARSAAKEDACVLNYLKVEKLNKDNDQITGVIATDQLSGREYELQAKVVINATGVFADSVRQLDESSTPEIIEPSQGIHIILDASFLSADHAIMIPKTDDGRVLFAIPWHGHLMFGTTDTPDVPIELEPRPLEEEIDYLLEHAGRYLQKAPSKKDVLSVFAGIRPLVRPAHTKGGTTSKISRDHHIDVSASGLITIVGGKWTTYRHMAEDTIDQAIQHASLEAKPCCTLDLEIHRSDESDGIAENDNELNSLLHPDFEYKKASIIAAARFEMALSLEDALARRTRCLLLNKKASCEAAPEAARLLAGELGKDEAWIKEQTELFIKTHGA
ncbi:MAG: glycerol-3-phosphate dehydrogenase/oxidase [Verrucomicrobiales bacterium]|nr:glycerol-3-phosphate dehydrogenase/oxidase [Verrucomicrobiales bacterium]